MEKVLPKLRFPEFQDNWKENKLSQIAKFSKGKGISKSDIDENGEIETRASAAKEPFKQQIGNYIEYKNLIAAAKELINNNYIAVKETNKTEKGIEEKNLDQEFNKKLREKIQELEKQKKPERDLDFSR